MKRRDFQIFPGSCLKFVKIFAYLTKIFRQITARILDTRQIDEFLSNLYFLLNSWATTLQICTAKQLHCTESSLIWRIFQPSLDSVEKQRPQKWYTNVTDYRAFVVVLFWANDLLSIFFNGRGAEETINLILFLKKRSFDNFGLIWHFNISKFWHFLYNFYYLCFFELFNHHKICANTPKAYSFVLL